MRALWLAALVPVAWLALGGGAARSEAPHAAENVVLVEGSDGGARWASVVPLLEAAGLQVTAVETPGTALADSIAATTQVLAALDGPTVLVAEGWKGAVTSTVGTDAEVSALVYVAALAPEAGEDFASLTERFPIKRDAAQQTSAAEPVLRGKIDAAAWRDKPTFYAVSNEARTFSPELQRFLAARMNAKTIVLDGDAPHPREIAGMILEAAGQRPPTCGGEGDGGTGACAAPALPRSLMKGCKCTKGSLEDLTKP